MLNGAATRDNRNRYNKFKHCAFSKSYFFFNESSESSLIWLIVSEDEGTQPRISHFAIKVPPFYRNNSTAWFRQLEPQFVLGNIKSKFHHLVVILPEDIAA